MIDLRRSGQVNFLWARTTAVLGCAALICFGCGTSTQPDAKTAAAAADTASSDSVPDTLTPLIGSVPVAPIPFAGSDGKIHLIYELSVTNFSSADLFVDSLEVLDASSDEVVEDLDAEALQQRLHPAGSPKGANHLTPGQSGMVFLHVFFAKDAVPDELVHRVRVIAEAMPDEQNPMSERIGVSTVDRRMLPVLSAPLAGDGYIVGDGCCEVSWRTRAVLPINGKASVAQRYAIDYEQADEKGRIFTGDASDPASYAIYGNEVLAVADGTVVDTRNDLPEQIPGGFPTDIPFDETEGNFVVLDIGDGFYVNYAHLQPGSIPFRIGQKVARGDVVGLVGNTGNTVAPHLHFHVMDGPSPLAAPGIPYLHDRFALTGQVANSAAFEEAKSQGIPLVLVPGMMTTNHVNQLLLDLNVVTFTP